MRVGGGLLLLIFSIRVVAGRDEGESADPDPRRDITVFPLAMPLIAGPGAITAAVVLAHEVENKVVASSRPWPPSSSWTAWPRPSSAARASRPSAPSGTD